MHVYFLVARRVTLVVDFGLRNHHRDRGLCEQIKPSQRACLRAGLSATKSKTKVKVPILTQIAAILVVMGNGLWLPHQDWTGFGWLTKTGKIVWSEETQHLLAC